MGTSADRSELDDMRGALAGSVRRRLALWAIRWVLGFAAIAVFVHFYPTLAWLFWAGAAVAALSLVVTLSIHAFGKRRLDVGERRLDEYERIAREAEEKAAINGKGE
jgi:membrane protein YdbS with pleckstrin-like domain